MPRISELTIAARYRPMTAVAGDFYDFIELDRRKLGILIADVTGHGVPAALIASMVKVALSAQRDHADRPAMVLAGMNEVLCGRLAGQYVTAAYLFIDGESRLIRYGAAGHPAMLRSRRADRRVDEVERNGVILGFLEDLKYCELEEPLEANDRFLMYTDGLIEASGVDDDFFGVERLKATLRQGATLDAEPLADKVLTTVEQWSGRAPGDDVTLVVVDWSGAEGMSPVAPS
jgi:serine phosphatase RsbU (regulator of sigma subunit)